MECKPTWADEKFRNTRTQVLSLLTILHVSSKAKRGQPTQDALNFNFKTFTYQTEHEDEKKSQEQALSF